MNPDNRRHSFEDLIIVGYADCYSDDQYPMIAPPIFENLRNPNEFIVPPYKLGGDVWDASVIPYIELCDLEYKREITRFGTIYAKKAKANHVMIVTAKDKYLYLHKCEAEIWIANYVHQQMELARANLNNVAVCEFYAGRALLMDDTRPHRFEAYLMIINAAMSRNEHGQVRVLLDLIFPPPNKNVKTK